MLRATPGCLLMKPARSSVSTIWATRVVAIRILDVGFGVRPAMQARIEVDGRPDTAPAWA